MNTSANNYDAIEQLIFEENIKIEAVDIHASQGLLLLILNTKAVLRFELSAFTALKNANAEALNNYIIIAQGTGIHWPDLDEDLSLKGFLQHELKRTVNNMAA
jgi:hypothetical protein